MGWFNNDETATPVVESAPRKLSDKERIAQLERCVHELAMRENHGGQWGYIPAKGMEPFVTQYDMTHSRVVKRGVGDPEK